MTLLGELPALVKTIPGILEDHVELLSMECQYESQEGKRRFLSWAVVGVCVVNILVLLQLALLYGFWKAGFSPPVVAAIIALIWTVVGVIVYRVSGRRPADVGEPFAGSREELQRSLKWMRKHLS